MFVVKQSGFIFYIQLRSEWICLSNIGKSIYVARGHTEDHHELSYAEAEELFSGKYSVKISIIPTGIALYVSNDQYHMEFLLKRIHDDNKNMYMVDIDVIKTMISKKEEENSTQNIIENDVSIINDDLDDDDSDIESDAKFNKSFSQSCGTESDNKSSEEEWNMEWDHVKDEPVNNITPEDRENTSEGDRENTSHGDLEDISSDNSEDMPPEDLKDMPVKDLQNQTHGIAELYFDMYYELDFHMEPSIKEYFEPILDDIWNAIKNKIIITYTGSFLVDDDSGEPPEPEMTEEKIQDYFKDYRAILNSHGHLVEGNFILNLIPKEIKYKYDIRIFMRNSEDPSSNEFIEYNALDTGKGTPIQEIIHYLNMDMDNMPYKKFAFIIFSKHPREVKVCPEDFFVEDPKRIVGMSLSPNDRNIHDRMIFKWT